MKYRFLTGLIALCVLLCAPACRAEDQYRVLALAVPSQYHYEFEPVARDSLTRLARKHAFGLTWATSGSALEQDLHPYAVILLLNTATEQLNTTQRAKLEAYMRAGGNAVIVHRAAITLPVGSWPWYEKLVGRTVGTHPMLQTGVVTIRDPHFPATFGVPARWIVSDEFYPLLNPYHVAITPVLNVDENSYDPEKIWPGQVAKPMGKDHPVAWYHSFGKGRVFVTTLGHNAEMYDDPVYLSHLAGGIYWAATGRGISP